MPPPSFTWDPRTGRYRGPGGRLVRNDSLELALDRAINARQQAARALSASLRAGDIGLPEWQQGMRQAIKDVHLYSAALARGGWANMTPEDFGRIGPRVRFHYGKLQKFAEAIEAGLVLDGRFTSRVELYLLAGKTSWEDQYLRLQRDNLGRTEEFNQLNPADHCDECVGLQARGWVPIGTTPRPGTRQCLSRCRCRMLYR